MFILNVKNHYTLQQKLPYFFESTHVKKLNKISITVKIYKMKKNRSIFNILSVKAGQPPNKLQIYFLIYQKSSKILYLEKPKIKI